MTNATAPTTGRDQEITYDAAVRFEQRGPVTWIHLTRPDAMNALNGAVLDGIEEGLHRSVAEGSRCVVVTGEGRAFCAGADLKFIQGALADPASLTAFLDRAGSVFRTVEPMLDASGKHGDMGGRLLDLAHEQLDLQPVAQRAKSVVERASPDLMPHRLEEVRTDADP